MKTLLTMLVIIVFCVFAFVPTASFYAGSDWASFLRKDNVELTVGVQANSFAGGGNLHTGGRAGIWGIVLSDAWSGGECG